MEADESEQTLPSGGQPAAPLNLPRAEVPVFRPRNRQLTMFVLAFVFAAAVVAVLAVMWP